MAGNRLHDLFTVFTFKTPPSGDFVYQHEDGFWAAQAPSHAAVGALAKYCISMLAHICEPTLKSAGANVSIVCLGNDRGFAARAPRRAREARALPNITFSAVHAELDLRASLDGLLLSDTPGGTPQKNSPGDCCKSRRRFASVRANKGLP